MILAAALTESGYRAYTPTEVVVRRARRTIPRKEMTLPLMPGLVFAAWPHLADMITLPRTALTYRVWDVEKKRMTMRGYPFFRVLQVGERYARVTDAQLNGVRLAESQRAVKVKRGTIKPGAAVRMIGGMLDGLIGAVEAIKGNYAQVRFPGWHMPIATALGLLEEVKP
jgi:hypothetical protein